MKTELKTKVGSNAVEVRIVCDCRNYTEIFYHDGKDRMVFFCNLCDKEYHFKVRIRPPCDYKKRE
jgi:hypothetical protein